MISHILIKAIQIYFPGQKAQNSLIIQGCLAKNSEKIDLTPGWKQNLDKSQCTSAIDSANNAVLSADFKNVIFKMIHWA